MGVETQEKERGRGEWMKKEEKKKKKKRMKKGKEKLLGRGVGKSENDSLIMFLVGDGQEQFDWSQH